MLLSSLEDQELVKLYVRGSEKAFEHLLNRHKDRIYRFICSKIRDRELALDYFQETFIKVVSTMKSGNYNEEGKFLPWVMRIANNLIIDNYRKNKKVKLLSETRSGNDEYSVFNRLSVQELNILEQQCKCELEGQMVELLNLLPENQRSILNMRIFQDLSFKEIADEEGISINTALGRMRYALINLRKLIEKHGIVMEY
ncbi:MAG: sigma-70 family RNA polymerase sigma factor [Bacteroidetes bacterium]|nr:sigma-70 family RNA polymerase sigma factor [Bacteroidota bacterium]